MNMADESIPNLLQWFASLGVGGILAAFMFLLYRKDMKEIISQLKITVNELISVVKENTASNTKLIHMIESQERNTLRKADLLELIDRRANQRIVSHEREEYRGQERRSG